MIVHRVFSLLAADPTAPQINLNGTAKQVLMDYWLEASDKLREAIETLNKQSDLLNGRDFVPQGGDNWRKARAEHTERMKKLDSVYKDIQFILEAIHDQKGGR